MKWDIVMFFFFQKKIRIMIYHINIVFMLILVKNKIISVIFFFFLGKNDLNCFLKKLNFGRFFKNKAF